MTSVAAPSIFGGNAPNKCTGKGRGRPSVHLAEESEQIEDIEYDLYFDPSSLQSPGSASYFLRARDADAVMAAEEYSDDLYDALAEMGAVATPYEEWIGLVEHLQGHLPEVDEDSCLICEDPTTFGLTVEEREAIGWGECTATCFMADS